MGAKFYINNSGRRIRVYDTIVDANNFNISTYIGDGVIYTAEVLDNPIWAKVKYHHASDGFKVGYVHCSSDYAGYAPLWPEWQIYSGRYGYYAKPFSHVAGGYKFQIRRSGVQVFNGTFLEMTLGPGDAILTDGNSDAGRSHGDRLSIFGARLNGSWYYLNDGWVKTGLHEGFETPASLNVYSTLWPW